VDSFAQIPTHSVAAYTESTYAGNREAYNGTNFLEAQVRFQLLSELASGRFSSALCTRPEVGRATQGAFFQAQAASDTFCNNPTFDHADNKNPEYNYVDNGCRYPLDAEVSVKSGRDFFITTFSARKQESYIKPNGPFLSCSESGACLRFFAAAYARTACFACHSQSSDVL